MLTNKDIANMLRALAFELEENNDPITSLMTEGPTEETRQKLAGGNTWVEVKNILEDLADRVDEIKDGEKFTPKIQVAGLEEGGYIIPRFATLASRECAKELSVEDYKTEGGENFQFMEVDLI
jgi:hypothetical protein